MAPFDRILSPPAKVVFAGWETTTTRLQQAGWQLSAEEDFYRNSVRLACRFEPCGLYMIAESLGYNFIGEAMRFSPSMYIDPNGRREPPVFYIRHCSSNIMVRTVDDFSKFHPIDAIPQMVSPELKSIDSFPMFAVPLVRTEEIIVEPATVSALLDQIKSMQVTDLAEIRKRRRYQEGSSAPMPQQNFHAQILSLAA